MTAPTFAPTDQYDLLALVADTERATARDDVAAFLAACEQDAAAHDGLVSVNRVRALMADRDIEHHRYSALWAHFTGKGRPMVAAFVKTENGPEPMWETCKGSQSGNNGRPYRLRRWVGAA